MNKFFSSTSFVFLKMLLQSIIATTLLIAQWTNWADAQFPPSIKITGFIRDMTHLHPHAQLDATIGYEQRGLLSQTLTNDGLPINPPFAIRTDTSLTRVLNGSFFPLSFTRYATTNYGQFYFDDIYVDAPGFNIALPFELTLNCTTRPCNGVYDYNNNLFFPIDGQGYTREHLTSNTGLGLSSQTSRSRNYWFGTELNVPFYYRGGEVFSFNGDDDLWVYIDGKLTNCDLGSNHPPRFCSVTLDNLGLARNKTYTMVIFHAERNWSGSSFQVTTSIVPINARPVVSNVSISVRQDSTVRSQLSGFDPDYNPDISFRILTAPRFGTISRPLNTPLKPDANDFEYAPQPGFVGNDEFSFVMNDATDDSDVGYVKISVDRVNVAPVASSMEVSIMAGETMEWILEVTDRDNARSDLTFVLLSTPQYGYASVMTVGNFTYQSVNAGKEVLEWQVSDASPPPVIEEAVLRPTELVGIIVGGAALFIALGIGLAYFLYWQLAAAKFYKMWEKEFRESRLVQNPLYQRQMEERFNPLYVTESDMRSTNDLTKKSSFSIGS